MFERLEQNDGVSDLFQNLLVHSPLTPPQLIPRFKYFVNNRFDVKIHDSFLFFHKLTFSRDLIDFISYVDLGWIGCEGGGINSIVPSK